MDAQLKNPPHTVPVSSTDGSNGATRHDDSLKALRDDILQQIEAQKSAIERQIHLLHAMQRDHEADGVIAQLQDRLRHLDGLTSLGATAGLQKLMELSYSLPTQAASTQTTITSSAIQAAVEHGLYSAEITHEMHQAVTLRLEQAVRATDAANTAHLSNALRSLDQFEAGAHFRQTQADLEAEREAARKRGDHSAARMADALLGHNTLNAIDRAIELEGDPEQVRQLHIDRAKQVALIAEREAAMAKQFALDARRQATELDITGKDADAFVTKQVSDRMASYKDQRDAQWRAAGQSRPDNRFDDMAARRDHDTAANRLHRASVYAATDHVSVTAAAPNPSNDTSLSLDGAELAPVADHDAIKAAARRFTSESDTSQITPSDTQVDHSSTPPPTTPHAQTKTASTQSRA